MVRTKINNRAILLAVVALSILFCVYMLGANHADGSAIGYHRRVIVSDMSGNQIYHDSRKSVNRYELVVGESYLLYIGVESGAAVKDGIKVSTIDGIPYDSIRFEYDEGLLSVARLDGCHGGFFVISGVRSCDDTVVNVAVNNDRYDEFFNGFSFSVSFAEKEDR